MLAVTVKITGYVDDHFPGFVSCELRDAHERTWQFTEKVPVVSLGNLTRGSTYPQLGEIRCILLSRPRHESGRATAQIETVGVESAEGNTIFEVLSEQLVEVAG